MAKGCTSLCVMSPPGTALYRSIVFFDHTALHNGGQIANRKFALDPAPLVALSSLSIAVAGKTPDRVDSKTDCSPSLPVDPVDSQRKVRLVAGAFQRLNADRLRRCEKPGAATKAAPGSNLRASGICRLVAKTDPVKSIS